MNDKKSVAVSPETVGKTATKQNGANSEYTTLFSPLSTHAQSLNVARMGDSPPSKKKPVRVGRPAPRADRQKGVSPVQHTERITVEIVIECSPMGAYDLSRILRQSGPRLWLKHYLGEAIRYVLTQATGRHWTFKVVEGRVRQ